MKNNGDKHDEEDRGVPVPTESFSGDRGVPAPTDSFRRRAWRQFQRALDPLAPPRPLPMRRRPH
jgi:hypothetical protein